MSYRELDQTSDALAAIFNARRIAHGTVIGVRLVPSIDLIIVMLGLMKIGATYLPLDINLPIERIAFMLSVSGSKLIITSSELTSGMGIAGVESLLLEELQVELENLQKISKRPVGPSPEDSAYICFTSGSTGFPKGVRITHDSLLSLMSDITVRFGIGPYTKMALNTSISFDVSIAEIWMTLCAGGRLFVAGSSKSLVGERLADFIVDNGVTHIAITPSVLASVRRNILPTLECIICAGEPCPSELIEKWAPGRRFINAYGPTEATIYATASECRPGEPVTIGKALAHTRTYVLDSELNHLPPGQIGELYLGGVAVAKGYIGLEEESREKFVILRQASKQFDRIYKTGDLVKIDGNGNLVFIGRLDNQIKILGNRIELEEIECSIKRFEGIVDAAVCVDDSAGSKELVCFAVLDATQSADWAVISERLAAWLPSYMLPSRFERVQFIPLTPSGKKDRRALITRHRVRYTSGREYQPPRNDIEAKLISIWKGILKIDPAIGVYDAFTSLGGDSLQKLLLIDEVEQKFDIRVPPGYFGPITTIAQLAIQIANLLRTADPQGAPRAGSDFRASRIYKQLRDITADWRGARAHDGDLIVSYGGDSATYDFFFFVQQESQLHSLFKYIGDDFRLHGMRSGILVMNYSRDNVERLCSYYIEELNRISPRGKLVIGGMCEGSGLAHTMASMLQNAGGRVSLLILMEQARLLPFNGHAAFFYAKDSYLNPFNRYDSGTARYDNVYGAGYSLDILPGNHGTLFDEPIVQLLAKKVRARVADVL